MPWRASTLFCEVFSPACVLMAGLSDHFKVCQQMQGHLLRRLAWLTRPGRASGLPCATGDLLTCSRRQLLTQQQPKFRRSSFPAPGLGGQGYRPRPAKAVPGRGWPGARSPERGPAAAGAEDRRGNGPSRRCG